jgi:hypothetical protein
MNKHGILHEYICKGKVFRKTSTQGHEETFDSSKLENSEFTRKQQLLERINKYGAFRMRLSRPRRRPPMTCYSIEKIIFSKPTPGGSPSTGKNNIENSTRQKNNDEHKPGRSYPLQLNTSLDLRLE